MKFCLIFLLALVLAKDAQTDIRIETTYNSLMSEFEQDLYATALQSAQADFQAQYKTNNGQFKNVQQIYLEYKSESDALLATFKPIAHQIIENAAYNKNLRYYIYDEKLRAWHFYGRSPPNPPVDGSRENPKILAEELKEAWMKLLGTTASSHLVASIQTS